MLRQFFADNKDITIQEAVKEIQETEEWLKQKQNFVEAKIQAEISAARENAATNKVAALQALKRKRHYEKLQLHIDNVLQTTEYQREALTKATTNKEIFKIMIATGVSMKHILKFIDFDQLPLYETVEMIKLYDDDVGDDFVIYNPVKFGNDINDVDLIAELDEFEQEIVSEKFVNA